ncbi:MAG: hypothetical protein LBC02_02350 [Planctomycetaceae bacterium]|nr:hypothetical protein [Planctomycetaceae bacterium]
MIKLVDDVYENDILSNCPKNARQSGNVFIKILQLNGFLSDFRPNTGSLSAIADRCFGETSPTLKH